jgi:hypothetical protein
LGGVPDCLFNIFADTLHIWRLSPPSRNLRIHQAVVTRGPNNTASFVVLCLILATKLKISSTFNFIRKRNKLTGDGRKLYDEKLHILYSLTNIFIMIKSREDEMGKECNTNGREEKCL